MTSGQHHLAKRKRIQKPLCERTCRIWRNRPRTRHDKKKSTTEPYICRRRSQSHNLQETTTHPVRNNPLQWRSESFHMGKGPRSPNTCRRKKIKIMLIVRKSWTILMLERWTINSSFQDIFKQSSMKGKIILRIRRKKWREESENYKVDSDWNKKRDKT